MDRRVGNPWKRARTVPLKRMSERTSDFELSASEIAMSWWKRGGSGEI